jgi:ABC-type polysaccharide/polyol phosphate transport system ATPase subunit
MSAFLRCENLYKTYILRRRRSWLEGDDDDDEDVEDADPAEEERAQRLYEQADDSKPKREQPVLRGVSFSAGPGEVVGVVGAAGCGKSTLLDILARKTLPTSGKAEGKGLVIGFRDFQRPLSAIFSVRQNLRFMAALHGFDRKATASLVEQAAAAAGGTGYLEVRASRVPQAIFSDMGTIFALLLRPDILLLDDVRALVSTRIKSPFPELFARYLEENECIAVIASNKLAAIERHATKVVWLHEGKVRMDGAAEEVLTAFAQFMEEDSQAPEPGPHLQSDPGEGYTVAHANARPAGMSQERWVAAMTDRMEGRGGAAEAQQQVEKATLPDVLGVLSHLAFGEDRALPHGHRRDAPLAEVAAFDEEGEPADPGDGAAAPTGTGYAVDKPLGELGRVLAAYVNTARAQGVVSVRSDEDVELEVLVETLVGGLWVEGRVQYSISVFDELSGEFGDYTKMAKAVSPVRFEARQPGIYSLCIVLPSSFMGQAARLVMCKANMTVQVEPLPTTQETQEAQEAQQDSADPAPGESAKASAGCSVRWAIRGDLRPDLSWDSQKKGTKAYAPMLRPQLAWRLSRASAVPEEVLVQSWPDSEEETPEGAADSADAGSEEAPAGAGEAADAARSDEPAAKGRQVAREGT